MLVLKKTRYDHRHAGTALTPRFKDYETPVISAYFVIPRERALDEKPLDTDKLAARFCQLWRRCAVTDAPPEPVWESLQQHYQQPHRFYHTLAHLQHCLGELDTAGSAIEEADITEMALWFHDFIYLYGAADNEVRSAEVFMELAGPNMPEDFSERVCEFIIATQHTGNAPDQGTAFMVDLDLSGFGLPWAGYLADSDALRQEAARISDKQYYQGKLRFLDELQGWPAVFQTEYFRERLESKARANILRYSTDLRAQGFGAQAG
jgi:predicted metal-dependent HD superfamily phosphohydrolase